MKNKTLNLNKLDINYTEHSHQDLTLTSNTNELTSNKPKNFRINSPFTRRKHLLVKPIKKSRFLRRPSNNYKKSNITSDLNDS